ncbi:MAG: ribosome maturation factor RimM [Bacteroidota bacterium]|nr:ribosome maturation factor RimM [Bacteroidota bacterium]
MPDLCLIADIIGPHGVRGLMRLRSQSDVEGRFRRLYTVWVGNDPSQAKRMNVRSVEEKAGRLLVSLETVETRTQAQEYVGKHLYVEEKDMEPAPPGRYYVHDLIGCSVRSGGHTRGTVTDVLLMPAQDLYVVACGGKEVLIPAVPAIVTKVDIEARCIDVAELPGLFEDEHED